MQPSRIAWTNKSVLKFAGKADPIALIESKTRDLVFRARDAGWVGPPYNPLIIADILGIPAEPNSEVADARTVPTSTGIKIEFNPTRPRERVRFSIAHEIAHSFFPDVAEAVRHRRKPATSSDEWQLEMLCNLAASEFVMPIGSLPSSDSLPKIEDLMIERRKFDVSAEAFLMRVIKTTTKSAMMLCASPIDDDESKPSYRVDYCINSKGTAGGVASGTRIPVSSVIYSCTAIGQTNHAVEGWINNSKATIECVGIPGYPGAMYPRVACIARLGDEGVDGDSLRFVQGDVLKPAGKGPKVICQLVNDQARIWGGGVARHAAKKYPNAQQQFVPWFMRIPRGKRLGLVHFAEVGNELFVASLVAQEGFGTSSSPRIRYASLERCFLSVAQFAKEKSAEVHMPRIGAGQSGGTWATVEEIVRDTLIPRGVRVTVHDLPPKRQAAELGFSF